MNLASIAAPKLEMVDENGQPVNINNMPSVVYPRGIMTKLQMQTSIDKVKDSDSQKIMQLYAKSSGFMRLALREMLLSD